MTFFRVSNVVRRLAGLALFATAVMFAVKPAEAVTVTVGAITYDLNVEVSGNSYSDLQGAIETTPWWQTDAATATQFADAYAAAAGPISTPLVFAYTGLGFAAASYSTPGDGTFAGVFPLGGNIDIFSPEAYSAVIADGGSTLNFATVGGDDLGISASAGSIAPYPSFSFVTGTVTAVPEINGPVLAQLTLVLGVLYLGLKALRRRGAAVRLRA